MRVWQGEVANAGTTPETTAPGGPSPLLDVDLTDPRAVATKLQELVIDFAPKVAAAIVILVLGWLFARFFRRVLKKGMQRARVDNTLVSFISNVIYTALLVFVVVSALGKLGVPTNSFVAIIGAAGLAVGFALQGSLSNFAAGVMIILFRPFRVGDYIEGAGEEGTVDEIQIFQTVLNTIDNRRVIVPNNQLTSASITNYTANPKRRIDLVFGIGYTDDIQKAKDVLRRVIENESRVLKDPEPTIVVGNLGESSVDLYCRPWVKPTEYFGTKCALLEAVKLAFDEAGISIPFPQRDVHLHQVQNVA
ncbi:MAG: mechanosensitive ion channel [Planctomycetes bacterium]|nr:mechanosensitive ion channel [Planctomycetota bacterium]MCB9890737.1 mechanosensitive ion channel [Planctomycetota bacterium]MCB9920040.1 mechanosensitive ion channel [Planctomycetota bacterium]